MNTFQTNYQALENDEADIQSENVIIHVASEGSKSRWNHIDDLDSFFRKVYQFHQKHGFYCIIVDDFVVLSLFVLVLLFIIYLSDCVYFDFEESSHFANITNVQLSDLFMPVSECAASFSIWTWLLFVIFIILIVIRIYKFIQLAYSFKEIEHFYETAMKIPKSEIHNVTWHEVQCKLREVQHEQQMCVHKSDLTELDIYHRILRNKNWMVALVNKNILPLKYHVKFIGEWVFFSSALEYNLELIFFNSLLSPFKGAGILKEEYKKYARRKEIAAQLSRNIAVVGVLNLILAPFIFVWQLFKYFVAYSGMARYEPHFFSTRTWSPYSRLYLRHFNELDHEMNARLSRAYRAALEYTKSFSNPLGAIIFNFFRQLVGAVVVFFLLWGLINEKVLLMEHVIPVITVGSIIFYCLSPLIPDENEVFYPNHLMQKMIADIHYVPDHFKTMAHTTAVRDEFNHLFPYRMVFLVEELISPLVTPFILLFHIRHRALEIVDFFRCFTVDVAGVGDVCSFALMDISKHGNQTWVGPGCTKADQLQQAEDGKTELSLIHFKMMNPHWSPPDPSTRFIDEFREQVNNAKMAMGQINPYYNSLNSISTIGSKYASLVNSIHVPTHPYAAANASISMSVFNKEHARMNGGLAQAEGPPYIVQDGGLPSLTENEMDGQTIQEMNPMEIRAADMSLGALFLHEVHDKYLTASRTQGSQREENNGNEGVPLLDIKRTNYVN